MDKNNDINFEKEKLELEKQRLNLEKERLELENQKYNQTNNIYDKTNELVETKSFNQLVVCIVSMFIGLFIPGLVGLLSSKKTWVKNYWIALGVMVALVLVLFLILFFAIPTPHYQ